MQIHGHQSNAIANNRGLLQGSSLSPILFNFFIDDLLWKLQDTGLFVKTRGLKTNVLAYADDLNIHAKTVQDLQVLLNVCESWSVTNGIQFSTSKSIFLSGSPKLDIKLYGTNLL